MPSAVERFEILPGASPPRQGYIHVTDASQGDSLGADITVHDQEGRALVAFSRMQFAEIEGNPLANARVEDLVHHLSWVPAALTEQPHQLNRVFIVASHRDGLCQKYEEQLAEIHIKTTIVDPPTGPNGQLCLPDMASSSSVVIYIPQGIERLDEVASASKAYCQELLAITKGIMSTTPSVRVFVITQSAIEAQTPTSLAYAPLLGLGRIIAAEQPDIWGAVIDIDCPNFPLQAIKYVVEADVIKIEDTVSKVCRLRSLPQDKFLTEHTHRRLMPRPGATYVVTGGLGVLGLEVLDFLAERGARRFVLVSRKGLPARCEWANGGQQNMAAVNKILALEELGIHIHILALDLTTRNAASTLRRSLEDLGLPEVRGVVHAAGVLDNQLVQEITRDAFDRVLEPKVDGALAVHQAFPVGTLDFSIWFSSCGQLFGFPGQASYASGNAFLDSLASHRHAQGEDAVAFQWTSWRGLGMAASSDFIEAELESKGITSVTREEAFRAWDHASKYDTSHACVLRSRIFQADEALPMQILQDIALRRQRQADSTTNETGQKAARESLPPAGKALSTYLQGKISDCVASVLQLSSPDDVDAKVALPELGMDSVMTVAFRRQLQQKLNVKVPPTLVWAYPTVAHLVKWFAEKLTA